MKGLSLQQPWASLVAEGFKTIETRTWTTSYRGPLLICSTAKPKFKDKPLGQALAICCLTNVTVWDKRYDQWATDKLLMRALCPIEGRYLWSLDAVQKIEPFAIKGQQGLWNVHDDIAQAIKTLHDHSYQQGR